MAKASPLMRAQKGLFWPTVGALFMFAFLAALGTWQMQRLHWKNALLAQIESNREAKPVAVERILQDNPRLETLEYRRVWAKGRYRHELEMYFYAINEGRPGWHVYTPLEIAGGAGGDCQSRICS